MKLYAVKDVETGKLVCNITNPRRKFWEKRGSAQNAIDALNSRNHNPRLGKCPKKENLIVVEFDLVEVKI